MRNICQIIFILFSLNLRSQIVLTEWQNTIGSEETDGVKSFMFTSDGGYLIGGNSYSGVGTDKDEPLLGMNDCWIIKIDSIGVIEWQRTLGGTNIDFVNAMVVVFYLPITIHLLSII